MQITKPSDKPMAVKTLFGRHYVNRGDYVWVKFQDSFARKKAAQLMPGDEILLRKDGVSGITLEQVGEALAKSQSYQEKAGALFVKFEGTALPVFQHALLSGVFKCSEQWPSIISNDVSFRAQFQSGKQFELGFEQLAEASEFIRAKLISGNVSNPVTISNIHYNWLMGNVICPINSKQVALALTGVAPDLSVLLDEGFRSAYKGYLAARIGIMRAVSGMLKQPKPSQAGKKTHEASEPRANFRPEIAEIIRLFANDLSSTMFSSPVISVGSQKNEAVATSGSVQAGIKKPPGAADPITLFKGIVTGRIDEEKIARRKIPELAHEYNAIEGVAIGIVGNLIKDNCNFKVFSSNPGAAGNIMISTKFELSNFLGYREFHLQDIKKRMEDERIYDATHLDLPYLGEYSDAERFAKLLGELILTGKLDDKYRLPRGTLKAFFEYESKVRTFLPPDLMLCLAIEEMVKSKKKAVAGKAQATSFKREEEIMRKIFKSKDILEAYGEMRKKASDSDVRMFLSKAKLKALSEMPDSFLGLI